MLRLFNSRAIYLLHIPSCHNVDNTHMGGATLGYYLTPNPFEIVMGRAATKTMPYKRGVLVAHPLSLPPPLFF
jgi:hypothetical protein